jgi:hypothetical protein
MHVIGPKSRPFPAGDEGIVNAPRACQKTRKPGCSLDERARTGENRCSNAHRSAPAPREPARYRMRSASK